MNETDTLVNFGGALKTLSSDGDTAKLGGYLVRFGSPTDTDATRLRDFFTKNTDFDIQDGATSAVYYNHGLNSTLKTRKLGIASLRVDDVGVWMETELKARDDYERRILQMAQAGKLGLSSGTAAHLVERKNHGDAHEITRWPLGLDASLTPTPAEPKTSVAHLKSIVDEDEIEESEIKKYDPNQARDEDGKWSIIRGQSHRITGKKVNADDIHKISDHLELSGHARNALLKAHESGKIKTDGHLLRTIAAADDAMGSGHASTHHAVIRAATALHGAGGTHENKPWHTGGDNKPSTERIEATRRKFARKSYEDDDEDATKSLDNLETGQLSGSRFVDHAERLLDANSEFCDRSRDLMADRADSRKGVRLFSDERLSQFTAAHESMQAVADEMKALLDYYAPQREGAPQGDMKPDSASNDAAARKALADYQITLARLHGVAI